MEDFNALASALAAGVVDVRGCLILSRDGLVLGAYPSEAETQTKPAWLRFATMGDPERGFAQFGTETWCYARRGPYAAFAVAGLGARPGLIIDHIEQVLLAAEQARGKLEGIRSAPIAPIAPTVKPRTPLHAERPIEEPVLIAAEAEPIVTDGASGPAPTSVGPPGEASSAETEPGPEGGDLAQAVPCGPSEPNALDEDLSAEPIEASMSEPAGPEGAPPSATAGVWVTSDEGEEVDRFSLSREFGQLLQDDGRGADGYPTRTEGRSSRW
jgi:hypothetical protein